MGYGGGLKAIEFVERVVDGSVCNEVVDIVLFRSQALLLVYKGGRAGEGVVDISNYFRI